jgi:hypothetical protein
MPPAMFRPGIWCFSEGSPLIPDLDWVPVSSSNIAAVAYEEMVTPPYRRMWVKFKSGAVYSYDAVPRAIYDGFLAAPSKGEYLYYIIRKRGKDSVYAYDRRA